MPGSKISLILIFFILSVSLISSDRAISAEKANKKLELKVNYSHLISFDEKVIRYRAGDKAAFEVEILPDIFNDRHELLVKPLQEINTNLLVWTRTKVYNFDIEARQRKSLTKFFSFNKDKGWTKKEENVSFGDYELDLPPFPSVSPNTVEFELDAPPELN